MELPPFVPFVKRLNLIILFVSGGGDVFRFVGFFFPSLLG